MNELIKVTIDDLNRMDGLTRREYLDLRKEWLKQVRKEDKRILINSTRRIHNFKNREKTRKSQKKYYSTHTEQIKAYAKKYEKMPGFIEKRRIRSKKYYHNNIEDSRKIAREFYAKNKDKLNKEAKERYHKNKEINHEKKTKT